MAAGSDDVFYYVGTITAIDAEKTRMTVAWTEDGSEHHADVIIGAATSVTRDGTGVSKSELRIGIKVVVIAEINIYVALDVPEATDIMLGRTDLDRIFQ